MLLLVVVLLVVACWCRVPCCFARINSRSCLRKGAAATRPLSRAPCCVHLPLLLLLLRLVGYLLLLQAHLGLLYSLQQCG